MIKYTMGKRTHGGSVLVPLEILAYDIVTFESSNVLEDTLVDISGPIVALVGTVIGNVLEQTPQDLRDGHWDWWVIQNGLNRRTIMEWNKYNKVHAFLLSIYFIGLLYNILFLRRFEGLLVGWIGLALAAVIFLSCYKDQSLLSRFLTIDILIIVAIFTVIPING